MMRIIAGLAAVVALSACSNLPDAPFRDDPIPRPGLKEAPPPPEEEYLNEAGTAACAAEAYQALLGQAAAEIDRESLPRPHRIFSDTDMVTMDYRADRLNIVHDQDGAVIRVYCG